MNTLDQQWQAMLDSAILPVFEIETRTGDFIMVDLCWRDDALFFEFDTLGLPVYFDGDIRQYEDYLFSLPYDEYMENLDAYLEVVYGNIVEGFLIPNKLEKKG